MIPYAVFYSILLLIFILSFSKKISKKNIYLMSSGVLILFGAIRYNVGWDYNVYERILRIYRNTGRMVYERDEYLSNVLYKISASTNIYLFFVITSIITFGLISYTLYKQSNYYMLGIIFFVVFPLFYMNSFSVIRNFVAISITFYASKYIFEKKPVKYIVFCIIASLFHKSAYIALMGLIPMYLNIYPIVSCVIVFLGLISRPFWTRYLLDSDLGLYNIYVKMGASADGQTAFIILAVIYLSTIIITEFRSKRNILFNQIFFMYSIGILIFLSFWGMGVISHRLSLYFTIYVLLLLPYVVKDKFRLLMFIVCCTLLYMYMIIGYSKSAQNDFIPYQTLFNLWERNHGRY